jgi:hypothetical protein
MKKTKVLAFLMAATMLASCGKTPVEESSSSASDTTMVSDPSVSIMDVGEGTYTDLEVGSVFSFGTYNGQAINWIVVSKEFNSCELLALDCIDVLPFAEEECRSWRESDLRDWLVNDLYVNAFSSEERMRIDIPDIETMPELHEDDVIYLPSVDDLSRYSDLLEEYPASEDWWLRSGVAYLRDLGDICTAEGEALENETDVTEAHGVRPAMHFYAGNDQGHLEHNGERYFENYRLWPSDDIANIPAGALLRFGTYNGEPVDWIVLSKDGIYIEIVTMDVIAELPLDEDGEYGSWDDATLNSWLNSDFYEDAFDEDEKARIEAAHYYATEEEANVYLLSEEDLASNSYMLANNPASGEFWLMSDTDGVDGTSDVSSEGGTLLPDGRAVDETCGVRPVMKVYCGADRVMLGEITPTPVPVQEIEGDPMDADEDQYAIFMGKIDEIEAEFPGSSYAIIGRSGDYYMLIAASDSGVHFYVIRNGEIMETESDIDLEAVTLSSYEGIRSMPYLGVSDPWYYHSEYVDSLEDGIYYGSMYAMSEDGTSIYVVAGHAVTFDRSYMETFSEGDQITYIRNGVEWVNTIDHISEYTDDNGTVHRTYWLDDSDLWISDDYDGNPDIMMLMSSSGNPCREYNYIVELPVSSSCVVTDTFHILVDLPEYEDQVPTGNPLFDSYWWYVSYSNDMNGSVTYTNGWYECHGLLYPIELRNGEVVRINIEWR